MTAVEAGTGAAVVLRQRGVLVSSLRAEDDGSCDFEVQDRPVDQKVGAVELTMLGQKIVVESIEQKIAKAALLGDIQDAALAAIDQRVVEGVIAGPDQLADLATAASVEELAGDLDDEVGARTDAVATATAEDAAGQERAAQQAAGMLALHQHSRDLAPADDAIWIPAAAFDLHTGGAIYPTGTNKPGSRFPAWRLPASTLSEIITTFRLPRSWAAYNADIYLSCNAAPGGTYELTVTRSARTGGEALAAGDFAVTKTVTVPGTAATLHAVQVDADYAVNGDNRAAVTQSTARRLESLHHLRIQRPVTDATATTVDVLGVLIRRVIAPPVVVCDGNSLTKGDSVGSPNRYPELLQGLLTDPRTPPLWITPAVTNKGVNSQTTQDMIADAGTDIDPLRWTSARASDNVLVGWEGTNALFFGATRQQAYDQLVTYYAARKAAGWKVVAVTILPRSNTGTPGSFEADRQWVNRRLRAHWRDFAHGLADVAADPLVGQAGQSENATYYADKVHMTAAGYARIAAVVAQAVARVAAGA